MLSDGRRYLLGGERPSALDVTFCSLAYPLVSPPELKSVVRTRHSIRRRFSHSRSGASSAAGSRAGSARGPGIITVTM